MALLSSILTGGVNNHPTTSEEANAWSTDFISEGIVGSYTNTSGVAPATGAFAVNAQGTPDMTVAVSAGVCYVQGTPTSQNSQTFRIKNTASENVTISANSSGSTKYDWVYIKLDATKLNGPNVAGDDAATLVTSRSTSQSSDDGTPPTYGYPIAVVTVSNGATSITNGNIRDSRANCIVNLGSSSVSSGWTDLGYAPNTVTANGNRSYSLVFNSVDLTGTVSNGMRLKLPRTVTPPTQCTSLNGTTQYWNKTSGLTSIAFTDDFAASAWINLSSYPTSDAPIMSRINGTQGWWFGIDTSGRVILSGHNASAANYRRIRSYQSIPLNKWVHVAAQEDMSANTNTTTTCYVMIDGVNVPAEPISSGTNPTTLVQAGNLEFGTGNAGTGFGFLPGKIAQAALYNAKVTQATMLASMNQTLSGSETSIVGAWTFNGNGNDSSANALNLTAQASATATTTDSPFNATEYGIIMANTFSTDTTLTVQVPEGYSLPTSGGVDLSSYSTQKTPYGFPVSKDKWRVGCYNRADRTGISIGSTNAWFSSSLRLSIPVGEWTFGAERLSVNFNSTVSGNRSGYLGLKSSTTWLGVDEGIVVRHWNNASGGSTDALRTQSFSKPLNLTSQTTYTLYAGIDSSSGTETFQTLGTYSAGVIFADNAYL